MKIIFVSEIQDPYTHGSSTQIVTDNLLDGLYQLGADIVFVAIYDKNNDPEHIKKYYSRKTKEIITLPSKLNASLYSGRKYKHLFRIVKGLFFHAGYDRYIRNIRLDGDSILISHTPSLEAFFVCKRLLKRKKMKYIQYWSDPYAIAGIYPENLNIKRYPAYVIERKLLEAADSVVYPCTPLFEAQRKLYQKHAHKMKCTDFSYSLRSASAPPAEKNRRMLFGYIGDYSSYVRNIVPLFRVFPPIKEADLLICGKGDIPVPKADNITLLERVPQNEAAAVENKPDVLISILNHSCLQIPGKIFYPVNTDKILLVILDGKYREDIKEYLGQFSRFEFCDNNEDSIRQAVKKILRRECKTDLSGIRRLSPKHVAATILGTQDKDLAE